MISKKQLTFLIAFCIALLGYALKVSQLASVSYFIPVVQDQAVSVVKSIPDVKDPPVQKEGYVRVTRIVDGDTIVVMENGKEEKVRLIGVDTPETVDSRRKVQCFGKEASQKTKDTLLDKEVLLKKDPTQTDKDKYGRLLRYVYLSDGTLFNKELIKEGYAHEYTYRIPYVYQTKFKLAQKEAEENKRGLWQENVCSQ